MRWDFWSFGMPPVTEYSGASAKTTGRAFFLLGVKRDLPTSPAGDMGLLVHLSH
jgi:hypothetical protein